MGQKSVIGSPQCHAGKDQGFIVIPLDNLDKRVVACSHMLE